MTGQSPQPSARSRLEQRELEPLLEFLRIPSISAIEEHAADVRDAASWVTSYIRSAGGQAEVVDWNGHPLVDGLIAARTDAAVAPTVLCYGHFDTQPVEPLELWASDPFSPSIRDDWLYARGVADDKGQLWALLKATADLARNNLLPVNVRFCCDGEEEVGGSSIVEYIDKNSRHPDACVIFDAAMLDSSTPVFTVASRGTIYLHVEVETGSRDLHSGVYGGAALNAVHVLITALNTLIDDDGRPCEALREDVVPPSEDEVKAWEMLPDGDTLLATQGAVPAAAGAGDTFYERTWALPSLDVNGIEGGSPNHTKTIIVSRARANLSMRVAPGQDAKKFAARLAELLTRSVSSPARLDVRVISLCDAANTAIDSEPILLAAAAVERVMGRRPLFLRSGGSLPLMPLLERLGIPTIVTGFDVPEGNIHAPNERMSLTNLTTAVSVAKEMLLSFGSLSRPTGPQLPQ